MKKLLATMLLCVSMIAGAAPLKLDSCFPKNDLYISADAKGVNMTKIQFNQAIEDIESIYKPYFKKHFKAKLEVVRKWDDGTVNAYAQQAGKVWKVSMFGGLARHKVVTLDGFRAVVCHEIGHHVGGAPKIKRWGRASWASNEGQADYFATSKCLKKFFEKDHENTIKIYQEIEKEEESTNRSYAKKLCDQSHASLLESAICLRGAMAGQSLAELFRELRRLPKALRFDEPDKSVVKTTNHKHPAPQCRIDTYFQGALCNLDEDLLPSQTDAAVAFCNRKDGYKLGVRSLCWLKLSEYGL